MQDLHKLVNGVAPFDSIHADEYTEWCSPNLNPEFFERLRQGLYPIQAYVDLHHLTIGEGRRTVHSFIWESYLKGLCCVLVVHGKGRNSCGGVSVLKKRIPSWLRAGLMAKVVKAYVSAKRIDGGLGALYVLLEPSRKYASKRFVKDISKENKKAARR
jgi:DNA-nicking Smr family endonuclease